MRCYPTQDVNFFWERKPGWDRCSRPDQNWKAPHLQPVHTIHVWRDVEGAKMDKIEKKDLYFPDWNNNRRRPEACLPFYYCTGSRFIKLEKAGPIDYKCAAMPIDLQSAQIVRQKEKEENLKAKKEKAKNKKGNGKNGKKSKK